MGNLRALAERATTGDLDGFAIWLERRLHVLRLLPQKLAESSWSRIQHSPRIITISRSSAVFAAVEGAWERGWQGSVVVLDGAPSGRGQDQAERLNRIGEASSRPDAGAPELLEEPGVVVMVGADAVGPSSFVNAVGTRMLLELAQNREVVCVLGKKG